MDCFESRRLVRRLHEDDSLTVQRLEEPVELFFRHVEECPACRTWFMDEMCDYVVANQLANTLDRDTYMLHGFLHLVLNDKCKKVNYALDSKIIP